MNSRLRLRDDVRLDIQYCDETPFGSAMTELCDRIIANTCEPIRRLGRERGADFLRENSEQLLKRCFSSQALGQMYARPGVLHESCLYPPVDGVRPIALSVFTPETKYSRRICRVDAGLWSELARWIETWSQPGERPQSPRARALWDELEAAGAFTSQPALQPRNYHGVTYVGHATVAMQSHGIRILFDPFLLPPAYSAPSGYRPWLPAELAPHAIFITHSHPDHFDIGTLLRLGADTPIFVPFVERESLLAIDMCSRLRELGFNRVSAMRWGQEVWIGPHRVKACPFYGEQPSDSEVLHPEARNSGNVYVVESNGQRIALVADAGRDQAGDCKQLASKERGEFGSVDTVFGGYRAWRLFPAQYLATSVPRYVLFVPPQQWGRCQQIMNNADDLLETAARWGARQVVPYANGGAPWYWDIGLGPGLDAGKSDRNFDPDLQAIAEAGEVRRKAGKDVPRVIALHPGEQLRFVNGGKQAERVCLDNHIWPFFDHTAPFAFPSVRVEDQVLEQEA